MLKLFSSLVFVETLSTMGAMVAFAFASKDETKIIKVLNNVIKHYQKFNGNESMTKGNQNSSDDQ